MNPRKLIKNIPSKSQQWKAPVKYWIRDLYEKQQRKITARRASKLDKPSTALSRTASRSSWEPIPAEPDFLFDDDSIPPDLDFLAGYDSIPVDVDVLADDDSIPVDVDFLADDDSIPF